VEKTAPVQVWTFRLSAALREVFQIVTETATPSCVFGVAQGAED
jgi:hypothetical protein